MAQLRHPLERIIIVTSEKELCITKDKHLCKGAQETVISEGVIIVSSEEIDGS